MKQNINEVAQPSLLLAPDGFELIPSGSFIMGDTLLENIPWAPAHTVYVSAFYIAKYEITSTLWNEVCAWAAKHEYRDLNAASNLSAYPARASWYNAVEWCNARSEKEGFTPCYTLYGEILRNYDRIWDVEPNWNTAGISVKCNWNTDGYRLPTEAEWEKAARGGLHGKRFPWGDVISHEKANFNNACDEIYANGTTGHHPAYRTGSEPYHSPVGSFAANGYGLYDMAGNVSEWCWDRMGDYDTSEGVTDPRGSQEGSARVLRGGHWNDDNGACCCRVAYREYGNPGYHGSGIYGFRVARNLDCMQI